MLYGLKGKVALVTGGDRGIGAAIGMHLAEAGCHILLHAREPHAGLDAMAADWATRYRVRCTPVIADFRDPVQIAAMFDHIDTTTTRLDILVNNAGFETSFAAESMPLAAWQAVLQVNLNAPFRCSQEAARRMKPNRSGVIINISSIHDSVTRKGLSHYCAAKAALSMLGRCTALEWAEYGIRVVNVSPGAIETDITGPPSRNSAGATSNNGSRPAGSARPPTWPAWSHSCARMRVASHRHGDLRRWGIYAQSCALR